MARYYRKVIRIRGEDSPNVRLALAQIRAGVEPTNEIIVPGVLPWSDYQKRRLTWDPVRQCIGLDAEFYAGSEVLLYPPNWINRAEWYAEEIKDRDRKAIAIGIDPAEGGDKTSMAAVDEYGILDLEAHKTMDTSKIVNNAIAFGRKHKVNPRDWVFDRGGGGKQHADQLRSRGFNVRTVGFGASVKKELKKGLTSIKDQKEVEEEKYAYKNLRSEMYGALRLLLDPTNEQPFGIPAKYTELRHQMALIPLQYDTEGRLNLPPKNKRSANSTELTLVQIIGHSPDELDSVVLAIYGMQHLAKRMIVGGM